jgi:2-polyprenyl-3-methyl-5-hydroxy-6-metoxy-1,4-benzoquinol methylase
MTHAAMVAQRKLLTGIIRSYKAWLVRNYCRIRFLIIRQDFLNEVGQYLPTQGRVLDIGCGFGLFSLYFAGSCAGRQLQGYDLNAKRIAMARLAARTNGIRNVRVDPGDALALSLESDYDAIYALDLLHHLPQERVPGFVQGLYRVLRPGGVLIVKDVDNRPWHKRWFTLALDRLMVGLKEPVRYWPRAELRALLQATGFRVYSHTMRDILPYPHMLYVCWKDAGGSPAGPAARPATAACASP